MARLPHPGEDELIWGDLLNEFLRVEHNNDGTLRYRHELAAAVDNKQDKMFVTVGSADADYLTDGTADDIQINQALADVANKGGGLVYIKAGTYHIDAPVKPRSSVHLRGESMFTTVLAATNKLRHGIIDNYIDSTPANPTTHFILSDMSLDGAGMSRNGTLFCKGVNSRNWRDCQIRSIYCHDCTATGIGPDNLERVVIDHCLCVRNGTPGKTSGHNGIGIASGGMAAESFIVSNCICVANANNGFLVEADTIGTSGKATYLFRDNISIRDGQHAFCNAGTPNVSFIGNTAYRPGGNGVRCSQYGPHLALHAIIKANHIIGAGQAGIYQGTNQDHFLIEGNTVRGGNSEGILLAASHGIVTSNHLHDNARSGMWVGVLLGATAPITRVTITQNLVYNNGRGASNQDGMYLSPTHGALTNLSLTANQCYDTQANRTQRFGIALADGGTMENIIVALNNCAGNAAGGVVKKNPAPSIILANNIS